MPDDGGSLEKGPPGAKERERRSVPRFPFIASAKEVDVATHTELPGRVSEISEHGCFIDTLNPFPSGTRITIAINHHEKVFNATGSVIYVIPNMGMGIVFTAMEAKDIEILKSWLRDCG